MEKAREEGKKEERNMIAGSIRRVFEKEEGKVEGESGGGVAVVVV